MNINRKTRLRQERIMKLLDERTFLTVEELAGGFAVSVASIRRDLAALHQEGRIERTHGGAVVKGKNLDLAQLSTPAPASGTPLADHTPLSDQIDALIMTITDPAVDAPLVESFRRKNKPVIAESLVGQLDAPVVTVDNYQAGYDLGLWVAQYARQHWGGEVHLLELIYHLSNTEERSRGFRAGLQSLLPEAEIVLTLNTQASENLSSQLARDALKVYPHINVIFAINDTSAYGAYQACQELKIPPERLMIVPFGLEGNTFRTLLQQNDYVKAGLAMFPEIAGRVCLLAALRALAGQRVEGQLITPYAVLTAETLSEYYRKTGSGWELCWERVHERYRLPLPPTEMAARLRVGFIVRYGAHEWYQSMIRVMKEDAEHLGVALEIIDIDQTVKYELSQRRREIAAEAVKLVRSGSVIVLDGGAITPHFARQLLGAGHLSDLRVITNSFEALEIMQGSPNITVICTGGILRRNRPMMVGPIAESSLQSLRADQVFVMVSGISPSFGLSHDDISEVSVKQAMIKAGREVILLADHACFGQESFVHFSVIKNVNKIITDETLQGSFRLELAKQGIEVIVAR